MNPKVSVVIPVFNKARWIEETLISVVDQDYTNWEVIIVDDGSTDESLSVVQSFVSHHAGSWKIISQENQGQCKARNVGIENASGEFVAFLDGDDLWARNKLSAQVRALEEHETASLVICPYLIYDESQRGGNRRFVLHTDSKKLLRNWLGLRGFGGGTESTGLVRKNLLIKCGGFDPLLSTSAGLDLTMRLSELGEILFSTNTFMKYRIHTGQWHTNLDTLARDLATLRAKIRPSSKFDPSTIKWEHLAYIRLQEIRQKVPVKREIDMDHKFLINYFLAMLAFSILKRNIAARLRAKFPRLLTNVPGPFFQ